MSDTPSATLITAGFGFLGAVIVGIISFFGGRGTSEAAVQNAINSGFKDLTAALQKEREENHTLIDELTGRVANLEQHMLSLEALLRDNGIPVPRRPAPTSVGIQEFVGRTQ